MTTPHIHHDCIVAWAKGAKIQYRIPKAGRLDYEWQEANPPEWHDGLEYRVKPEPKPDVVVYKYISTSGATFARDYAADGGSGIKGMAGYCPNLKLILDGETRQLKSAEVI